jgi:hypothetical protein
MRARSGRDRLHQRVDAEDIDHSLHIVGQHLQADLRFDLFEGADSDEAARLKRDDCAQGFLDDAAPL